MEARLRQALARAEEVSRELSDPAIARDSKRLTTLGREHARLVPIVRTASGCGGLRTNSPRLGRWPRRPIPSLWHWRGPTSSGCQPRWTPREPSSTTCCSPATRSTTATPSSRSAPAPAATRRRSSPPTSTACTPRYCERHGLTRRARSRRVTARSGGLKEVIFAVRGQDAFGLLRRESGVHRVQRVPATETQGRIHTSAATVAVLPEAEEVDVKIEPQDLKIDVFRSSGPGGQSVNTTDSAVRITHLPTGPGGQPAGPEVAAAEQAQGHGSAPGAAARPDDRRAGGRPVAGPPGHGRHRRSLGQDPHLQLSRRAASPTIASTSRSTTCPTSWTGRSTRSWRRSGWPAGRRRPRVVADVPATADAALEHAAAALRAAGVPDPRREAARLAEAAWKLDQGQARLRRERTLSAAEAAPAGRAGRGGGRRANRWRYVSGHAGFRRLVARGPIARALIPAARNRRAGGPRPGADGRGRGGGRRHRERLHRPGAGAGGPVRPRHRHGLLRGGAGSGAGKRRTRRACGRVAAGRSPRAAPGRTPRRAGGESALPDAGRIRGARTRRCGPGSRGWRWRAGKTA